MAKSLRRPYRSHLTGEVGESEVQKKAKGKKEKKEKKEARNWKRRQAVEPAVAHCVV